MAGPLRYVECRAMLSRLMRSRGGRIFSDGEYIQRHDILDYYMHVKPSDAIDLGMVSQRLRTDAYECSNEFVADVNKVFDNAMKYNTAGSAWHVAARTMKASFASMCNAFLSIDNDLDEAIAEFNAQQPS